MAICHPLFIPGLNEAVMCAQRGEWRASANAYCKVYLAMKASLIPVGNNAYYCISGWTSILDQQQAQPDAEDVAALEKISKQGVTAKSGIAEWLQATTILARLEWFRGRRDKAAHYYRKVVEYRPTEAQRCLEAVDRQCKQSTEGIIFDEAMEFATSNLRRMRGETVHSIGESPTNYRGVRLALGMNPPAYFDQNARKRIVQANYRVGGEVCDCCAAPRPSPAEGKALLCCSGCLNRWYCSLECQKKHWKSHKKACRAPKDLHIGDYVRIEGLVAKPELNGDIVEVRGVAEGASAGRWAVAMIGGDTSISIHGDKLVRIVAAEELKDILREVPQLRHATVGW